MCIYKYTIYIHTKKMYKYSQMYQLTATVFFLYMSCELTMG